MIASGLCILLACASTGAVILIEGEDSLSEGRYCDLTEGGFGVCENKENCAGGAEAQGEKCSSPLVCCPPQPGAKSRKKCHEYSSIEKTSSCPGGDNLAAQPQEFPHMVAIGYHGVRTNKWYCGGVLISERYVLTAAQCVIDPNVGPPRRIRLGDLEQADREVIHVQQLTVEEVIPHPNYTRLSFRNDIALLKLSKNAEFSSSVRPACLYTEPGLPASTGVAVGWGETADHGTASELLKVGLPFVSVKTCQETYKEHLKSHHGQINDTIMICAGDKGKDTCKGDSGGPLQVRKTGPGCMANILGLTSFGRKQCGTHFPTIYTRVSHFVPWIESVVWP